LTLRIEVMPFANVPAALMTEINDGYAQAFPLMGADGVDDSGLEWVDGESMVIAWDGNQLGSVATVLPRTIDVGGTPVQMGGVGGVMTLPHMRGRGLGQAVMRAAVDHLCGHLRCDVGMLFCLDAVAPFYRSLGWQTVPRQVIIHQSSGPRPMPKNNNGDQLMVYPCGGFVLPDGDIDVQGRPW
jgi:GNAT superfamily N-acetyltransferase